VLKLFQRFDVDCFSHLQDEHGQTRTLVDLGVGLVIWGWIVVPSNWKKSWACFSIIYFNCEQCYYTKTTYCAEYKPTQTKVDTARSECNA
jgi:hypothetical protein